MIHFSGFWILGREKSRQKYCFKKLRGRPGAPSGFSKIPFWVKKGRGWFSETLSDAPRLQRGVSCFEFLTRK